MIEALIKYLRILKRKFDKIKYGLSDLDKLHYTLIRGWNFKGENWVYNGIDFFEVTQFYLWDKVSRAIRSKYTNIDFEVSELSPALPEFSEETKQDNDKRLSIIRSESCQGLPSVFILLNPPILSDFADYLKATKQFDVVFSEFFWGMYLRSSLRSITPDEEVFIKKLHRAIIVGLKEKGYTLIKEDRKMLLAEIKIAVSVLPRIKREFDEIKPDILLLHTDNHPPCQLYCFEARNRGIPVLLYQHGLDCEHYLLEECYSDYVAVWGKARKDRYLKNSARKAEYRITGNPNFRSHIEAPFLKSTEHILLWVTRPHASKKCYSPYHYPQEGQNILKALIEVLTNYPDAKLIIRPHPATSTELYTSIINTCEASIKTRIEIDSKDSTYHLIRKSTLVFAEDSTVALETMLHGRPLIHVHFAKNNPVLKLEEHSAAVLVRNSHQLYSTYKRFYDDPITFSESLKGGQLEYIKYHLDIEHSKSWNSLENFIKSIIAS